VIYPKAVIFPGQAEWVYVAPGTSLWRVVEMEAAIWRWDWRWQVMRRVAERLDEDAAS